MADTVTANYQWVKPEIAGSASTWGTKLNSNLDLIDAQVFANQTAVTALNAGNFTGNTLTINKATVTQGAYLIGASAGSTRWYIALGDGTAEAGSNAGSNFQIYNYSDSGAYLANPLSINRASGRVQINYAPQNPTDAVNKQYADAGASVIGEIKMFAGASPPAGWAFCFGQQLPTATYAALFAVIGYHFGGSGGNFNLPDLRGRIPVGYDGGGWAMGLLGGEGSHILSVAEMPTHNHPGSGDTGHTHGASQPAHTHTVQNTVVSGTGLTPGGVADGLGATTTSAAQPAITVNPAAAAIVIGNQGGNGAHNNMQPYQVIGYIIRIF